MSGPKGGTVSLVVDLLVAANLARANAGYNIARNTANTACSDAKSTQQTADNACRQENFDEVCRKFEGGKSLLQEAKRLQSDAEQDYRRASSSASRVDSATNKMRQASEKARQAKSALTQARIMAEQKQSEERERIRLMKLAEAANKVQEAKNDLNGYGEQFLSEWGNSAAALASAKSALQNAEELLRKEVSDEAKQQAESAASQFAAIYKVAADNKQQSDNREKITDAIIAALTDLQYDEPDVNYEPKDGIDNAMLGNITLFAKSKGESGDMRLSIDLDGKINLEVENIPEGQEAECHGRLTDLQTKVADTVDFEMTDWGRAKNIQAATKGCVPKQRVREQEKMKQRGT
ncbi:hypothetical protein FACS189454_02810 [Planctomycetales bacterium]|nr:hypothetical protein FACS189454_02810 [Planctomycetales bacterium]